MTVGSLLRREGRAAHSLDRPVVPRARDVAHDGRGPTQRVVLTAGALLAVSGVFGTSLVGDLGLTSTSGIGDVPGPGADHPGSPSSASPADAMSMPAGPLDHAMSALRAAGLPVSAAVGGAAPTGADIVAQTLGGPLVNPAAFAATAATTNEDGSAGSVLADEITGALSLVPTVVPVPDTGSDEDVEQPVRIPPVLGGGTDDGGVTPPAGPVGTPAPTPLATPAPPPVVALAPSIPVVDPDPPASPPVPPVAENPQPTFAASGGSAGGGGAPAVPSVDEGETGSGAVGGTPVEETPGAETLGEGSPPTDPPTTEDRENTDDGAKVGGESETDPTATAESGSDTASTPTTSSSTASTEGSSPS